MLSFQFFKRFVFSPRAGSLIRTLAHISVFGIGIGLFSLILVMSVMNGFGQSIRQRVLSVEPHLVASMPVGLDYAAIRELPVYKNIEKRKDVRISLSEQGDVILRTLSGYTGVAQAHGIAPEDLKFILKKSHEANKSNVGFDLDSQVSLQPGEILIGAELARQMDTFEGDSITIIAPEALLLPSGEIPRYQRMKVKGLITSNFSEIDQKMLFYLREPGLLQLKNSSSFQKMLELRLDNPDNSKEIDSIRRELISQGFKVQTWRERNSSLFSSLRLEKVTVTLLVGMSALISAFSLIAFLVLLITQKRKEIGLLMAIGYSKKQTQNLFLSIGMWLATIALFGGVGLGVIAALLVNKYSKGLLPDIYYDTSIPAQVEWLQVIMVLVAGILFCFFTLQAAVKRYANMNPSEALRKGVIT